MNDKARHIAALILAVLLLLVLVPAAGVLSLYFHAAMDLPDFNKITDYRPPLVTTVYDRNGDIYGYLYREKRFLVPFDEIPAYLVDAVLATEDSGFYEHEGIDFMAIVRAYLKNLSAGEIVQGGSTITQQLVKQLLLTSKKKYERKIKEAILAYRLENNLTKNEILTIYLNQVFFGAGAYGVEAAARTYFGKHVRDLTLAECALLAGLPKAPSTYNPYRLPTAAKQRQKHVLSLMLRQGRITSGEYNEALIEPLVYTGMNDPSWKLGAYYLEEVRRWLIEELSEENMAARGVVLDKYREDAVYESGLHVYTAMDPAHQRAAEQALRDGLEASSQRRGWRGPMDHLEPDEYDAFLAEQNATGHQPGDRRKALVLGADGSGADLVLAGNATARMANKTMTRFRGYKRLKPGDVVWVEVMESEESPDQNAEKGSQEPLPVALEQIPEVQGALVSIEPPTGEVVALVGGYEFAFSQFNRATQAFRQPGSAFKPVVYSAALDYGFTPASVINDVPFILGDWAPKNYGGKFNGPTTFRTALVRSRNIVTVRLAQRMGVELVIERAKALGLEPEFPPVLAISLGAVALRPINLCRAYTAFARDGSYVEPRLVLSVSEPWGEEIYKSNVTAVPAVSPQNAFAMDRLLQHVCVYGTGARTRALNRPVAGKTGTTNDEIDAWFIGFTPYLLTGVYVGFDQIKPMGRGEAGSRAALPIWLQYRQAVEERYPVQDFPEPEGLEWVRVDGHSMPSIPGTEGNTTIIAEEYDPGIQAEEQIMLKEMF